jgi:hypothetical protein
MTSFAGLVAKARVGTVSGPQHVNVRCAVPAACGVADVVTVQRAILADTGRKIASL